MKIGFMFGDEILKDNQEKAAIALGEGAMQFFQMQKEIRVKRGSLSIPPDWMKVESDNKQEISVASDIEILNQSTIIGLVQVTTPIVSL